MTSPWFIVTLYITGLTMILFEITVPGGVIGFIGGVLAIAAIYLGFENSPLLGFGLAGIAAIFIPLVVAIVLRTTMLLDRQRPEDGYVAGDESLAELIGNRGEAMTPLRPSGMALIAGRRVHVISQGQMIDPGTAIVVAKVEGSRVIVQPA
jgi:membrane-bound serine protease (ClpP class)